MCSIYPFVTVINLWSIYPFIMAISAFSTESINAISSDQPNGEHSRKGGFMMSYLWERGRSRHGANSGRDIASAQRVDYCYEASDSL